MEGKFLKPEYLSNEVINSVSFFSNKHVITAMIVAPILAVGSYYLVDLLVKETPSVAVPGQAYPLLAKSNCRFTSGKCDLVNAEFISSISVTQLEDDQRLVLVSNNPLQQVTAGFLTADGNETEPVMFEPNDAAGLEWSLPLTVSADAETTVRLALLANQAHYYAETTMGFSTYQTSFNKDFRK
ncbi:hypothetical protein DFR28_102735 [Arenicella xantha]|uniref:Uncharacterized protein n=1 Tax=Arenicella xantha TaxID=644221 RepID=A0A395JKJ4_9GAMM|nr:hypothetical protein DFR28_102735 [Arenicella xantha]